MGTDRLTVSIDEQTRSALDNLVKRTGKGQSELVRHAIVFYAANFNAAKTDVSGSLEEYHKMLSTGEHVLLDIDFLHCLLNQSIPDVEEPDPEFITDVNRVAQFHAAEYADRFDSLKGLLDWLSICGFLTVRETDDNTYHVVFPSERLRWFMTRFIVESLADQPFDIEVNEGVSKVLFKQIPKET